jgi:hypothetical protein
MRRRRGAPAWIAVTLTLAACCSSVGTSSAAAITEAPGVLVRAMLLARCCAAAWHARVPWPCLRLGLNMGLFPAAHPQMDPHPPLAPPQLSELQALAAQSHGGLIQLDEAAFDRRGAPCRPPRPRCQGRLSQLGPHPLRGGGASSGPHAPRGGRVGGRGAGAVLGLCRRGAGPACRAARPRAGFPWQQGGPIIS